MLKKLLDELDRAEEPSWQRIAATGFFGILSFYILVRWVSAQSCGKLLGIAGLLSLLFAPVCAIGFVSGLLVKWRQRGSSGAPALLGVVTLAFARLVIAAIGYSPSGALNAAKWGAIIGLVLAALSSGEMKNLYERTITYDPKTGKTLGVSDWRFMGTVPGDFPGCSIFLWAPLVGAVFGVAVYGGMRLI
ncbi:MAG: hypothetical protein AB1696_25230 [Planctomycetota bacterium]